MLMGGMGAGILVEWVPDSTSCGLCIVLIGDECRIAVVLRGVSSRSLEGISDGT